MMTALIKRADQYKYKIRMTDIRDQCGYVINVYLKNLTSAYEMLDNFMRSRNITPRKMISGGGNKHKSDNRNNLKNPSSKLMYSQ